MDILLFLGFFIGLLPGLWVMFSYYRRKGPFKFLNEQRSNQPPPTVNIDLDAVHRALDQIPNKVLQAVTSSTNNLKGNLGELIGYLKLHASYDRIIPLGNIVDIIAIVLPKNGKDGHIDFIDIKTGASAKLSKDQVQLKKLIEEKKINFVKLKVETSNGLIDETTT